MYHIIISTLNFIFYSDYNPIQEYGPRGEIGINHLIHSLNEAQCEMCQSERANSNKIHRVKKNSCFICMFLSVCGFWIESKVGNPVFVVGGCIYLQYLSIFGTS